MRESVIERMFAVFTSNSFNSNTSYYNRLLVDNRLYSKFLITNVYPTSVEIPTIGKVIFERSMLNYRSIILNSSVEEAETLINDFKNVIIPMPEVGDLSWGENIITPVLKTGDAIIKFIYEQNANARFVPFTITNGDKFFCGKGLIVDANYNILLMTTIKYNISEFKVAQIKRTIYVNPIAFTSKDLISKTIINKIIPTYISKSNYNGGLPIDIEIQDKSSWLQKVVKPKENVNLVMNELLKESINFITSEVGFTREFF